MHADQKQHGIPNQQGLIPTYGPPRLQEDYSIRLHSLRQRVWSQGCYPGQDGDPRGLDGVYRSGADGVPTFVEAGAPSDDELHALLHTVITRLMKMLTRRGILIEEMAREGIARQLLCSDIDGFSLHAAVRVEAHERKRLEQLCRYITRPALADERVQLNAAGQVELKLKTPWHDGTTHLVMSPLEFLQRLAALVPRPRLHLIRFHGVLAPNAKLRSLVVPQGPPKDEQAAGVAASGVQCEAETVQVRPARISWARLLKRVFDIDMQRCPNCGAGELKIIAAILERPVIERILAHLGLDPQPPPKGRAREAGLHFAA